jgi:hypothetical protein
VCVDFRNLNKCYLKENYPLPMLDHILQRVVGAHIISLLDGYFGYNQIEFFEDDKEIKSFTTPWGTFIYDNIPFGLTNSWFIFQRAMDIDFVGEKDIFMVIYLEDITIFSKIDGEHFQHLEKVFSKCRRYGIFLNPIKSHFSMPEGNLLGHIISTRGIKIDPKRVFSIQEIDIPINKKGVQFFIGKINFLRRFVPNFSEIIKPITNMLKKDVVIKWSLEEKSYFQKIKKDLVEAPILANPNYTKYLFIFSFAFEDTIVSILL